MEKSPSAFNIEFSYQTIGSLKEVVRLVKEGGFSAVIFDCFGTLLSIDGGESPYGEIMRRFGEPAKTFRRKVLSGELSESDMLSIVNEKERSNYRRKTELSLSSIEKFSDVDETLSKLSGAGVEMAVCSNAASPYAVVAHKKLNELSRFSFSCEIGFVKPDAEMYDICRKSFENADGKTAFVGDNFNNDVLHPSKYGFSAIWLRRE